MAGSVKQVFVRPENGLGAVAVVYVKIDDGDAFDAKRRAGVQSRDGGVIEKTKAHWMSGLSVMPWRPDCTESVSYCSCDDLIDGFDAGADRAQRRVPRLGRHYCFALVVNVYDSLFGGLLPEGFNEGQRVRASDVRDLANRGLCPLQASECVVAQNLLYGPKPVGALGMRFLRDVFQAFWMGDEKRAHGRALEGQRLSIARPHTVGSNELCLLLAFVQQAAGGEVAGFSDSRNSRRACN